MLSTTAKLRLTVGAGVLALLVAGGVALSAAQRAAAAAGDAAELDVVQGLLGVMLLIAIVLAWFAYASLQDDLVRRAEVEAALRASEAKFSGILEIAADAIISVDEQQRILHFNRGAELAFGYAAAELLGEPLARLIPSRYEQAHGAHVHGFGQAPESSRQMGERREIFGRRRDGTEFPAEASISKLTTASGARVYTVLLRDVTERKRLDEGQRRLAAAVATLGETLEVDVTERSIAQLPVPWLGDGVLLDVVTGAQQLRRVPSVTGNAALDAALRAVAAHAIDLDSPSRVVDVLRRGRTDLVTAVDDEWLEAHTADADELARMRALGMRSVLLVPVVAREHVLGVLKIFRMQGRVPFSEADRVVAEELALRAAFALDNARLYATARLATSARDHALGVVSHDLRNPISAIGMSARALLASIGPEDTDRRSLVSNIMESQDLTQRMIRDLLDVASIEVGRLRVERRPEPLVPILERAVALFEREAADRSIAVSLSVDDELPVVSGDAGRLVQVLSNLIANALRFTDRMGRVTVRARRQGDEVEVSVADTGSGIPTANLPVIFERYWTVRGNAPKGGTGLGLAIARSIVEAHGGRIWAESEVGKGSIFKFTVRVAG
ncbi:MAG: PAS domain S-box protein [Gemmatimonadetes bacterium]|nr:PAS domain S-box protein [Gemmatimonadota bacterium]